MDKVIEASNENPNEALIYLLGLIITVLCGVVVMLWKERKKEEVKNFNMLLRAVEGFKDNSFALERLQYKIDQLLKKYG
jgi:hypothetical protein